MIDLNNYYLHSINPCRGTIKMDITLYILEEILKSGYILSREKMGMTRLGGLQGREYISLCDYSLINSKPYSDDTFSKEYISYNIFVINSLSLIINKEKIIAIKPILIKPTIFTLEDFEQASILGNDKENRYSDLRDEVQVKDQISIDNIEGVIIPFNKLINDEININDNLDSIIDFVNGIHLLLQTYKIPDMIYDLDNKEKIDTKKYCMLHSNNYIFDKKKSVCG